jgi:hypothetical protein
LSNATEDLSQLESAGFQQMVSGIAKTKIRQTRAGSELRNRIPAADFHTKSAGNA